MSTKIALWGFVLVILGGGMMVPPLVGKLSFRWNCRDYLKRAADCSSVDTCREELDKAIRYAEDNGLTSGNSAAFIKTPECDVKFWYDNLVNASSALEDVLPESTPLEKSNVLMRVRETLLDGNVVTCPPNIGYYPKVLSMYVINTLGLVTLAVGVFLLLGAIGLKD